jgi:MarR-like DNA-binding transcriptional regulator SgrR of sgrS sRNA
MTVLNQYDRERQIQRAVLEGELGVPFTATDVARVLDCKRSVVNHVLRKAEANGVVTLDYEAGRWPRSQTNLWRLGDSLSGGRNGPDSG